MTIYQLHCNQVPFDDPVLMKAKLNIVDKDYQWPQYKEVGEDMADIVSKFLVKKPTGGE